MRISAYVLVSCLTVAPTLAQAPAAKLPTSPDEIRLCIFTKVNPDGFVDEFSKERDKAVVEVIDRMHGQKGVRIVPSVNEANVVVEITEALYVERHDKATVTGLLFGPPAGQTAGQKVPEIRAKLTTGTYETSIASTSALRWKGCWSELTASLKQWLKDNRAVVLNHRTITEPESSKKTP